MWTDVFTAATAVRLADKLDIPVRDLMQPIPRLSDERIEQNRKARESMADERERKHRHAQAVADSLYADWLAENGYDVESIKQETQGEEHW